MKKKMILLMGFVLAFAMMPSQSKAQSIADCLQQLALDVQKLSGLKSILNQMYQGYEILDKGYGAVKDISQGNYSLHEAFLDGLMIVSPTISKYPRVMDIINDQAELITEYKSAYNVFKEDKQITPDEIGYMMNVYNNLVTQSLTNLSTLTTLISNNKLRMSDDERLREIDRVYAAGHDELTFLRQFNSHTQSVALNRAQQVNDQQTIKNLYGIQ